MVAVPHRIEDMEMNISKLQAALCRYTPDMSHHATAL